MPQLAKRGNREGLNPSRGSLGVDPEASLPGFPDTGMTLTGMIGIRLLNVFYAKSPDTKLLACLGYGARRLHHSYAWSYTGVCKESRCIRVA